MYSDFIALPTKTTLLSLSANKGNLDISYRQMGFMYTHLLKNLSILPTDRELCSAHRVSN